MVHRLVAQAFLPNPSALTLVNHIDGNKGNNRLDNLEWITPQGNSQHAMHTGLNGAAKLKPSDVLAIRRRATELFREIAGQFDVGEKTIRKIVSGQSWSYIPDAGQ